MNPHLWTIERPYECMCAGAYRPQLNGKGKLVKARDPAWRMAEKTRDPGCLQERARAMAKHYQDYRLSYQHTGDSRKSGKGYPDMHLWAPAGSVFVELKRMGKDPDPHQVRVLADLAAAGHPVYLARPCCALSGALDQVMADLAGTKPRGAYTPPTVAPPAGLPPASPNLAAPPRPPRPQPQLPGGEPPTTMRAPVGYIVPLSAVVADPDAGHQLETWLRAAGFPPADVPFPIRLVAGDDQVAVHIRAGDTRVWRGGHTRTPFPEHLTGRLTADVIAGPNPEWVMSLIEHATPSTDLPATEAA